jgi:Glycosyl hydrolase family 47
MQQRIKNTGTGCGVESDLWSATINEVGAYSQVRNPASRNVSKLKFGFQSIAVAETLKYLHRRDAQVFVLALDSDNLPPSEWVFTAEAHPLLLLRALAPPQAAQ